VRHAGQRASPRFVLLAISILLTGGVAFAENIDPGSDGSKFAWAENLGWVNAQPSGPGGPGVQVSDSDLTGWAWSENAGWISLSCTNGSCAGGSYGVTNDGCGTLSGSAWSENAGWITFSSAGPNPYRVTTGWRRAVPTGTPSLTADKMNGSDVLLSWTALSGATSFDIVQGALSALKSSVGNFQFATQACIADNTTATSFTAGGTPNAGDGYWFLVRGENCGGDGTYDTGEATQAGLRDAEIAASGHGCP